ncbi:AraC family transcriptional regulator [Aquimarina longa]|uniref:AraC family transcriptional regulator n=1 Tax=Aquimarina longa TaxID=1080221 RepID=UPI0007856914|nr:AraC family transcriptional regulator [Aquimarina longa]
MKILPFTIPKIDTDTLIIQEDKGASFYNIFHQHEEIQMSLILSGEGSLIVGDTITNYKADDILVFGSQLPHVLQSASSVEDSHMISIFFTKKSFGDDFFKLREFSHLSNFFDAISYGVKVILEKEALKKEFLKIQKTKNRLERFIIFLQILRLFYVAEVRTLSSSIVKKKYTDSDGKRIADVFQFVMNNFHTDITLQEASNIASMTPNAFCRYFKQHTNKTFFQFLTEIRIENSCRILSKKPDASISEASYASGFKNVSNFNRKFKSLKGVTPSQYRKDLYIATV